VDAKLKDEGRKNAAREGKTRRYAQPRTKKKGEKKDCAAQWGDRKRGMRRKKDR